MDAAGAQAIAAKVPKDWRICEKCLTVAKPKKKHNAIGYGCWVAFFLATAAWFIWVGTFGVGVVIIMLAIAIAELKLGRDQVCAACRSKQLVPPATPRGAEIVAHLLETGRPIMTPIAQPPGPRNLI